LEAHLLEVLLLEALPLEARLLEVLLLPVVAAIEYQCSDDQETAERTNERIGGTTETMSGGGSCKSGGSLPFLVCTGNLFVNRLFCCFQIIIIIIIIIIIKVYF
jgi:hypothetical protein